MELTFLDKQQVDLDSAAEVFLDQLDPAHAALIREQAQEERQSPAAYIIATLKLARDRGETIPSLRFVDIPANTQGQARLQLQECQFCHELFQMTRIGQIYCPQPKEEGAESCARQAAMTPFRNRRLPPSPFEPKLPNKE